MVMDKVKLIFRVVSGEASDEEKFILNNWIEYSDENREEYINIKLLLENRAEEEDSDIEFPERLAKMMERTSHQSIQSVLNKGVRYLIISSVAIFLFSLMYRAIL